MKGYRLYTWIFLVLIFITNQLMERLFHIYCPVLFSYLDDVTCIPIILGMYKIILYFLGINKNQYLPLKFIVIPVITFSIWFEIILPVISSKYTPDLLDILMYCIGGIFYHLFFNSNFLIKSYADKKKIRIQESGN